MTNSSAPQHHSTTTIQHPTGGVVEVSKTHTLVPAQPPVNPLMDMSSWAPLVVFVLGLVALGGALAKYISGKLNDYRAAHQPLHDAITTRLDDQDHDLRNVKGRVDALEHLRAQDQAQSARMEAELKGVKEATERTERAVEKTNDLIINHLLPKP